MANDIVSLDQVKTRLKLELDEHDKDIEVETLADAALEAIRGYLGRVDGPAWPPADAEYRPIVEIAVLLLVEAWWGGDKDADGLPAPIRALIARFKVMVA